MGAGGGRSKSRDYKGAGGSFWGIWDMFTMLPIMMYAYVKAFQIVHLFQIYAVYFMSVTSVNKLHAILNYPCNSSLLQIIILSFNICVIFHP